MSIIADTSRIPGQLRQAFGQAQNIANQQGRQAGQSFTSSFGSSLKGLGAAVGVAGGIAAVGAAMKSAVTSGMDFTTALNTMQAVAGASSAQVAQVSAEARKLGTDSQLAATSSVDAANAMVELAKGGFTVDQSMKAARGTLQLAAAAQISAAEAATIQSQALQAFGKDADYAGKTADILANAANASSAEITDVAAALQQSGTVANQFGLSMSDTAASIALMANAGIQGSDAGTLLKSALLALTDGGQPAQTAIEQLGLTVYDANGKFAGMETLFGQLQAASKRMTPEMYQAATATLFGSDAMRLSGIAAQQGADGFVKMRSAMDQSGSAADVAAAKMQGLPGAWERLKNSAQDAGLAFYDAVQGPLTSMANVTGEAIGKVVGWVSELGPKIKDSLGGAWDVIKDSDKLSEWGDRIKGALTAAWNAAVQLSPVLSNVMELFGTAGAIVAAVGIESFVSILETLAGTLEVGVVPALQLMNSLLDSTQGLAVVGLAAFLGWRLLSPVLAGVRTQMASLTATSRGAITSMRGFSDQMRLQQSLAAMSGQSIGRFGAAVGVLGTRVSVIGQMQGAFLNASAGADRFGRTAGVAAAAGTGLRAAGAGLAGVFGGPVGLALTGAVVLGTAWASSAQRQKAETEAYTASLKGLAEAQKATSQTLISTRGAVTDDVYRSLTSQVDAYRESIDNAAKADAKWHNVIADAPGLTNDDTNADRLDRQAAAAQQARKAIEDLGMTSDEMGRLLGGSQGQWDSFAAKLRATGSGGQKAASDLQGLRDKVMEQQGIAQRVAPGIGELGEALRVMGDKSASSASKLDAVRAAMDAMTPARSKTEALAQYGETLRKVSDAAASGIGPDAFKGGELDAVTASGGALARTLQDLADKSAQVITNGGDMRQVTAQNDAAFQALATATGQPIAKIKELYAEMGGGKTLDLIVQLQGAPPVVEDLGEIRAAWAQQPEKRTIDIQSGQITQQTRDMLKAMNVNVEYLQGGKVLSLDVSDGQARAKVALLTQNMQVLGALKANPSVDLNKMQFDAKDAAVRAELAGLDRSAVSPAAGLVIDDLLAGKAVSMEQLNILSQTTSNPQVNLEIAKVMEKIGLVNTELDRTARTRTANIQPIVLGAAPGTPGGAMGPAMPRANGGITTYAQGGIRDLESYANGKLPNQAVIEKARPHTLVQWAEPETGGEAFIPLAPGKRGRSTSILATVADMFGFNLVPRDQLPDSMSGLLGAVAGGAVKRLVQGAGADGVRRFADGGMLRSLADGQGASRPLTGAPYVWGGVNWGDCSGAMSAFARMAAGLDPFGGRFSTATMGSQIQQMGGQLGRGGSGDLRFGWYNGGPGGGHTAGTLPDGTNIEMGGSYGGGMLGGSVGADDPQFTDHAYFKVGPSWTDPGSDQGGWVQRPDGTWAQTGPGGYDATGGGFGAGGGSTGSGDDKTLSGRLGNAASAFVSGQISDLFSVLSINDQPGWLAAITEYENQQKQQQSGGGKMGNDPLAQQQYEDAKLKSKQDFENAKLQRKQAHDAELAKLRSELDSKRISDAEYDRRVADLKRKHEETELAKKQEFDQKTLEAKQKFDQLKTAPTEPNAPGQAPTVRDPGTVRPAPGQDLGGGPTVGLPATGSAIKDAFRSGLREAWRQGPPWDATDWIINKESTWNPVARNGKYYGLGQFSPEVWAAAGKTPTADARTQGEVFDNYVGSPRYGDPLKAKEHHEANNWYDRGGIANGIGDMQKRTLKPERVLSPEQTEAFERGMRDGFGGDAGEVVARLDKLIQLLSMQPTGQRHYHLPNERAVSRHEKTERQRVATALAGA